MKSEAVIYTPGKTSEGTLLVAGVWRLWAQEGFPLEMAHLLCRGNDWAVDWIEAMADASQTNDLPALINQAEGFLADDALLDMKYRFFALLNSGKTPEMILMEKKATAQKFAEFIAAAP